MTKETRPQTYRVGTDVDAELRLLGKQFGGIDNALRVLLRAYDSTAWRRIGNANGQHGPFTAVRPSDKREYSVEYDEGRE